MERYVMLIVIDLIRRADSKERQGRYAAILVLDGVMSHT